MSKRVRRPQAVKARSVYDLAGTAKGRAVIVAGPGPSFTSFPAEELLRHPTIGVNAALELFEPETWLFIEGVLAKRYLPIYTRVESTCRIVTTWSRARAVMEYVLPKDRALYAFHYHDQSVLKMKREDDGRHPWWSIPREHFLPGRCTVASHALSLAVLMGASLVVTIGVDFGYQGDGYYAPGVRINAGPRKRDRALGAGHAWMCCAARHGVWDAIEILSVSEHRGTPGSKRVGVDEAVSELRRVNG